MRIAQTIGNHPWTGEEGWEIIEVTAEREQYSKFLKTKEEEGWEVYFNGVLQGTTIPAGVLIRKITTLYE